VVQFVRTPASTFASRMKAPIRAHCYTELKGAANSCIGLLVRLSFFLETDNDSRLSTINSFKSPTLPF